VHKLKMMKEITLLENMMMDDRNTYLSYIRDLKREYKNYSFRYRLEDKYGYRRPLNNDEERAMRKAVEGDFGGGGYHAKSTDNTDFDYSDERHQNEEQQLERTMKSATLEDSDVGRGIVQIPKNRRTSALMSNKLTEEDEEIVNELVNRLDPADMVSVMSFGISAQKKTSAVSDNLLDKVKTRDLSIIREDLQELVSTAQGYNPDDDPNWFERLVLRKTAQPLKHFIDGFHDVSDHIDSVQDKLMEHHRDLIDSMENIKDLYEGTLTLYREVYMHICALDRIIEQKQLEIDEMNNQIEATPEDKGLPYMLEDLVKQRDALDRQRMALVETQTLAAQDMSKLRNMKDIDMQMINKINQTMTHTVPLWKTTLAQIVEASKTQDVLTIMEAVNSFTDTLVRDGSTKIAEMQKKAYENVEKSIISKDAIRIANEAVINSTMASIETTERARVLRLETREELENMQRSVAESLITARNKALGYEKKRTDHRALADHSQQDTVATISGMNTAKEKVVEPVRRKEEEINASISDM
jgi:uncharacterized protein YaaN involved in tellurite resistance